MDDVFCSLAINIHPEICHSSAGRQKILRQAGEGFDGANKEPGGAAASAID
ncbi:hypothetical protein CPter291_2707 [Collimonas pratensis]|uniref:Uncharacterized protein n=1 Tax=Collimonas pratensis TaxID=279113 RepID=A0ABM5Z7I7_9BURK|nr:hypothetical protein CPter291_2707 [Collimonas pratensis]